MFKSLRVIALIGLITTFSTNSFAQGADGPAARQAIVDVIGTMLLDNYNAALESNSKIAELTCEDESKSDISTMLGVAKSKKIKGNKNNKAVGSFLKHIGIIDSSGDSITLMFNDAAYQAVQEFCFGDGDDDDDDDDDDFEEE